MHAPAWQKVRALVEESVGDVQLGQIRLQNDVPAGIEIFADPLIIKVFYNLVDNAVKHGVSTTTIRFLVEEREGVRSVVCEDDGAGVPPTMRKKIFTRGTGKDHGYGLFLSHEILSITGIRISEEGGSSGTGSRFVMTAGPGGIRGQ
jgi:signal transduction histidine kinase